jgi:hypothetical protein
MSPAWLRRTVIADLEEEKLEQPADGSFTNRSRSSESFGFVESIHALSDDKFRFLSGPQKPQRHKEHKEQKEQNNLCALCVFVVYPKGAEFAVIKKILITVSVCGRIYMFSLNVEGTKK